MAISYCCNCHRRNIQLQSILAGAIRGRRGLARKHFCCISAADLPHNDIQLWICFECFEYLFNKGLCYWPAMIWKFLSHCSLDDSLEALSMLDRWALIPQLWRNWWFSQFQRLEPNANIDNPQALFFDVSSEYCDFMGAIERLHWKELGEAMDKYLAFPTVRCPWGCSEFLHKTNQLSFETFLWHFSNGSFGVYAHARNKSSWVRSIRQDFPKSVFILENPNFCCKPSIIVDEKKGPVLLCCREHSKNTILRYLHLPLNPTGSLHVEGTNRYAPVSINSRSLRKAKIHTYSDTYQIAEMRGGYDGIDSMYLSSTYGQGTIPKNVLADERDVLSVIGREDMAYHVHMLSSNQNDRNFVPSLFTEDLIDRANIEKVLFDRQRSLLSQGATFINLNTVVNLQQHLNSTASRAILIFDERVQESRMMFFTPCWPHVIVRIHTANEYGEQFYPIPTKLLKGKEWTTTNTAMLNVLVCILTLVDEVWELCDKKVIDSRCWEGFMLTLIASKAAIMKLKPKWPFRLDSIKFQEWLPSIGVNKGESDLRFEKLDLLFSNYDELQVLKNHFEPDHVRQTARIIIVYRDLSEMHDSSLFFPHDNLGEWELRMVFITGHADNLSDFKVFARHGNEQFHKWWLQSSSNPVFRKVSSFQLWEREFWDVCVYVLKQPSGPESLRDRYLSCIGGQSVVCCKEHCFPLVRNCKSTAEVSSHLRCSAPDVVFEDTADHISWEFVVDCCKNKAICVCPVIGCRVGLCKSHQDSIEKHYSLHGCCKKFFISEKQCSSTNQSFATQSLLNGLSVNEDDMSVDSSKDLDDMSTCSSHSHEPVNSNCDFHGLDKQTMGPQQTNELIEDFLDGIGFSDEDDSDDEMSEQDIGIDNNLLNTQNLEAFPMPTTNVADETEDFEVTCDDGQVLNSISLHVLFNSHGHLLVRRKSKLNMSRRNESFLQRLVSMNETRTIPLAYPESLLFPDIFYLGNKDGSVLGALPTPLLNDDRTLKKFGVASLISHARIRTKDPSLLSSSNCKYQFFQFDGIANLGLRGSDSRVVLHRGLHGLLPNACDGIRTDSDNIEFYGDTIDSKQSVHRLAAAVGEDAPHYFYTQSCNQKMQRGLRRLREWIESEEAIRILKKHHPGLDDQSCEKTLHESAASFILSSWIEVSELWLKYIVQSSEMPLGKILKVWYRKEFQDLIAALFHLHCIFWTADDISTREGLNRVLHRIRGSIADIIQLQEIDEYMNEQNLTFEMLLEILKCAEKFLQHTCHSRCQVPVSSPTNPRNEPRQYMCKVPCNPLLSDRPQDHRIVSVPVHHTKEAIDVLAELGLVQVSVSEDAQGGNVEIKYLDPKLEMNRHVPRCNIDDGTISPVGGKLFVLNPSAQNLQFPTSFSLLRYLTKYVTEVDSVARVHCFAPTVREEHKFRGHLQVLNNTKIASVRQQDERAQKLSVSKNGKCHPQGRLLSQTEALTLMWGEEIVTTNIEFIHLPTCPREYRAAIESNGWSQSFRNDHHRAFNKPPFDLLGAKAVPTQYVREQLRLPSWRLFTPAQILVIRDEYCQPLKMDAITVFSIRPPELRFVNRPSDYLRWFCRSSHHSSDDILSEMTYAEEHLNRDVSLSEWLDGFGYKITLRGSALGKCLEYAIHSPSDYFEGDGPKRHIIGLLKRLHYLYGVFVLKTREIRQQSTSMQVSWEKMSERFLCKLTIWNLPVVWMTPVLPKNQHQFLLHILLGMGHYICEYELLLCVNIREAFIKARLFQPWRAEESIQQLMRSYIQNQLRLIPGSTWQFDRHCCLAYSLLKHVLLQTNMPLPNEMPPVLYSHIHQNTSDQIEDFISSMNNSLISTIHGTLSIVANQLPTVERLLLARNKPLQVNELCNFWPMQKGLYQNEASYQEQISFLNLAEIAVSQYTNGLGDWKGRNIVAVGSPGTGKTFVQNYVIMYCVSQGLNATITSLLAERAKELGGLHFHAMLGMKSHNSQHQTPGRMAEYAIANLYGRPALLEFLRRLDVLAIDELGLLSAEFLATTDMILRVVRKSSQYMGGLLLVCTMDVLQLLPFKNMPCMMSHQLVLHYQYKALQHSVRAANDPNLLRLQDLSRTPGHKWDDAKSKEFQSIIETHCTFVPTFVDQSVPDNAIYVFARKRPCSDMENIVVNQMKQRVGNSYVCSTSYDEESSINSNWITASSNSTVTLSAKVKEPRHLYFYKHGKYEFTHNMEGKYSQGQLAFLFDVPTMDDVNAGKSIKVWVAPPGFKEFPLVPCSRESLTSSKWVEVAVPLHTTIHTEVFKGILGRRTQYGLKPRIASTIHKAMGKTLSSIVTCVTPFPLQGSNDVVDFTLWEAGQAVVLLSRTRYAKDIIFVGDRVATSTALLQVLKQQNSHLPMISNLLLVLTNESNQPVVINTPITSFRPCDADVPKCKSVYALVSTKNCEFFYIGETQNLQKRLRQHNQGDGSLSTETQLLRPWALFAYVAGFLSKEDRVSFEKQWKTLGNKGKATTTTAEKVFQSGKQLIEQWKSRPAQLRLIRCGYVNSAVP